MIKRSIYFTILMLVTTSTYGEKILINLGKDCQAAWRLKQFNLRHVAYPFDWLRTYDFEGVIRCIAENFQCFLTAEDLVHIGYGVKNKRYGMEFVHDFPTVGSHSNYVAVENENAGTVITRYRDYLPQIHNKYDARIHRFLDVLVSSDEVIFIRTHIKPREAQKFVAMMARHYPHLHYTLLVVHQYKDLRCDWNIPHVMSAYVEKPDLSNQNRWWHETEWHDIFAKLNVISEASQNRSPMKSWDVSEID